MTEMPSEQDIQKEIDKMLRKEYGAYTFKLISGNRSGVPDLHVCLPDGKYFQIEVKKPDTENTLSPLQQFNLEEVQKRHGLAMMASSKEQVKLYLAQNGYGEDDYEV